MRMGGHRDAIKLIITWQFPRWGNRSEEVRILADEMQDLESKAMMLQLAADWESLAELELADEEAALRWSRRAISPRAT
jgi:hypothetical protein